KPEDLILLPQRQVQQAADSAEINRRSRDRVALEVSLARAEVIDLNEALALQQRPLVSGWPTRSALPQELSVFRRRTADRCRMHQFAVVAPQDTDFGFA